MYLKKTSKYLLLWGFVFFLASCAPKANLADFSQTPKDKEMATHKIPNYIIEKKKPKVAVLPPSANIPIAKQCNLYQSVHENLLNTLTKIGGLELVERGQLKAIMDELKFQEGLAGEIDVNKLTEIAKGIDYAMVGSISNAAASAEFMEARKWVDKKGKVHYQPPSCLVQGKVLINYRLISFPSGQVAKSFQMDGQKSTSYEVRYSSDCKVQDPCGILGEAIYRAVDNSLEDFQESFPAYGYIYKLLTNNKDPKQRIAFVSLGKADGLKPGSKLDIIEFAEETDPVTGRKILNKNAIAECTVLENNLEENSSLCLIEGDNAAKVKIKHAAKTKVTQSLFRVLNKGYRALF